MKRAGLTKPRCWWCGEDPLYCEYHDKEWGVPVHEDRKIFEMLILEGFQAGLSWIIILRKRDNFRKAFKNFDARKVARLGKADERCGHYPQPPEDRGRRDQCAAISGGAEGVRQLRSVHLALHGQPDVARSH